MACTHCLLVLSPVYSLVVPVHSVCNNANACATNLDNSSTLLESVLLPNGKTDSCLSKKFTLKQKSECLQNMLEYRYGPYFTIACPNFALYLADFNCSGCPWDRINPSSSVNPEIIESLDRKQVFHAPSPDCIVADHMWQHPGYGLVAKLVYGYGFLGSMMNLTATAILGSDLFVDRFHDAVILFFCWFLFSVGITILALSEDYFVVCESMTTIFVDFIAKDLAYCGMLYWSLEKCRRISFEWTKEDRRSWKKYVSSTCDLFTFRRRIVVIFYYASSVLVFVTFFLNGFDIGIPGDKEAGNSFCLIGKKHIFTGFIQYSKLLTEILAVTAYAVGPQKRRLWSAVRYILLVIILCYCVSIVILMQQNNFYHPYSVSQTIHRVFDFSIATNGYTELAHASVVAVF